MALMSALDTIHFISTELVRSDAVLYKNRWGLYSKLHLYKLQSKMNSLQNPVLLSAQLKEGGCNYFQQDDYEKYAV